MKMNWQNEARKARQQQAKKPLRVAVRCKCRTIQAEKSFAFSLFLLYLISNQPLYGSLYVKKPES